MEMYSLKIPKIEDFDVIPKGDMPGDKVHIDEGKLKKADEIFPNLMELLQPSLASGKAVVSVYGGSGVGKSEIGALLAHYLRHNNIGVYLMSGDNYPHRIPKVNDEERFRVFREYGLKGYAQSDAYDKKAFEAMVNLQAEDRDANPELCSEHKGLDIYQASGRNGLVNYLGSQLEIDFDEVNRIIQAFKSGTEAVLLKRMGRIETDIWYDQIDMKETHVLIIEWTHGNSPYLKGVDIPIFLNSTPEETREHRRSRKRDGNTDSPFTTMVLEIEQEKLDSQKAKARVIVYKNGEVFLQEVKSDE